MSYILEALKKSDQQRQQGAAPTLTTVQLPVEEPDARTFPWLVALAAVLFVAGIVIGWLQPWNGAAPVATAPPPVERTAIPVSQLAPPVAAPSAPSAPPDTRPSLAQVPVQVEPQKPPQAPPAPRVVPLSPPEPVVRPQVKPVAPPAVIAAHEPPAAAPKEPAPVARAKPAAAPEQPVMTRAELPSAIQQELPAMSVSLHAYSPKPGNRLVSINNTLLQEGDALAPGLVLEQITQKDMIFNYKGYRFRQGVQ